MSEKLSKWQEADEDILSEFQDGPARELLALRRQPRAALYRRVRAIPQADAPVQAGYEAGGRSWSGRLLGGLAGAAVLLVFLAALMLWTASLSTVTESVPGAPVPTRPLQIVFTGDTEQYPYHQQSVYIAPADDLSLKQTAFRELGIPIVKSLDDLTAGPSRRFDIVYFHPEAFVAAPDDYLLQLYQDETVLAVLNMPISQVGVKLHLNLGMEDLRPDYFNNPDYFTAVVFHRDGQAAPGDSSGQWVYRDFFELDQLPLVAAEIERHLTGLDNPPEATTAGSCPVTETVWDQPPDDGNADPFGLGDYYINEERTIWAGVVPPGGWKAGGEKVIWIRPAGTELVISGQLLDGSGLPLEVTIPCCYPTGFQVTGLNFFLPGCWQVNAQAGEHTLQFVTEVQPGDGIAYEGLAINSADLQPDVVTAGDALTITLTWQAGGGDAKDMMLFFHLYDQDGNLVAQQDELLARDVWLHTVITTSHRLEIPAELAPGEYTLSAGLYNPDTAARIPFAYSGEMYFEGIAPLTAELEIVGGD